MGNLYKSLVRNQNLIPTVQNIQKYLDEKRKQENLKNFLDLLQNTRSGIENTYDEGIIKGVNKPTTETWQSPNKVSTSQLIETKTENETMAPPEIPTDEGVEVDVLGDYSSTPGQIADVNKKANRKLADYLYGTLQLEDVSPEQKQTGANILSQIIKGEQPPEREIGTFNPKDDVVDKKTGEIIRPGREEETKNKVSAKDFKVIDGYYAYWDDTAKDWVKTSGKAPEKKEDQALGWAKFMYDMQQDKETKEKEEKESQATYNDIMGSEFVPMKDLVSQGLIEKNDPSAKYDAKNKTYKQGGAYVVRDSKGKTKLIFDDEQLEDYAKSQVSTAPNKWGREEKKTKPPKKESGEIPQVKTVEDYNALPSGTIYFDPSGKKRKKN